MDEANPEVTGRKPSSEPSKEPTTTDRLDPLSLAASLLKGGRAIAKELGWKERETFHALENRLLPAKKIGGYWYTTKEKLRRHFEDDEPS